MIAKYIKISKYFLKLIYSAAYTRSNTHPVQLNQGLVTHPND
jgi:hypothetical protein